MNSRYLVCTFFIFSFSKHFNMKYKSKIQTGPLLLTNNLTFKNLKLQVGTDENSKDAIYVMKGSKVKFEYCHMNSPVNTVLYAIDENSQVYMYGCVLDGLTKSARFLSLAR